MMIVMFEGEQNAFKRVDEFDTQPKIKQSDKLKRKISDVFNLTSHIDEIAVRMDDGIYYVFKNKKKGEVSDDVSHNDASRSS